MYGHIRLLSELYGFCLRHLTGVIQLRILTSSQALIVILAVTIASFAPVIRVSQHVLHHSYDVWTVLHFTTTYETMILDESYLS